MEEMHGNITLLEEALLQPRPDEGQYVGARRWRSNEMRLILDNMRMQGGNQRPAVGAEPSGEGHFGEAARGRVDRGGDAAAGTQGDRQGGVWGTGGGGERGAPGR